MKFDLAWAKTILSVYRYLENVCGAIDKIVMQTGLNSANIVGNCYFYNNVEAVTNKIINLSERKVTLINLKILTEEILGQMDQQEAQILIERYVDCQKCKDIAQNNDISIRSVFRKLDLAENTFGRKLIFRGYNSLKLERFLEKEEWIKNAYRGYCSNKVEELELSNSYLERAASL